MAKALYLANEHLKEDMRDNSKLVCMLPMMYIVEMLNLQLK